MPQQRIRKFHNDVPLPRGFPPRQKSIFVIRQSLKRFLTTFVTSFHGLNDQLPERAWTHSTSLTFKFARKLSKRSSAFINAPAPAAAPRTGFPVTTVVTTNARPAIMALRIPVQP